MSIGVQSLDVALRAELVREVLGARRWIQLPGVRPEIPGIVIWSGRAVAVLDLARFHPALQPLGPSDTRHRLVIVTCASSALAVPADRVSEVWKTHQDNLRPRQLSDFELSHSEVVTDDLVLPLFEPALLLKRLEAET